MSKNRFGLALALIDEANSQDRNFDLVEGCAIPRELSHAIRVTGWVLRLCPKPSEALLLAARAQHVGRWEVPRETYPAGRVGYLKWREDLKKHHARKAGEILSEAGYEPELVARVQSLILKRGFPTDPETRVLEDALCLVFIQYYLADFASRTPSEKMPEIIRKTWKKMSEQAREFALELPIDEVLRGTLLGALAQA